MAAAVIAIDSIQKAGAFAFAIFTGQDLKGITVPSSVKAGERTPEITMAEFEIGLADDEKTVFFCASNPQNKVLLTNKRFVKVQKSKIVSTADLSRLRRVNHQKNGWLHWDKVETVEETDDGKERHEEFGIQQGDVAGFFTKILQMHCNRLAAARAKK